MPSKAKTPRPRSIDEYLAAVPRPQRAALEKLRKIIRSLAPKAEECISYSIPAFRLKGKIIAGFASRSDYCSYYPFSGSTLATLAKAVEGYGGTTSALHFPIEEGLPKGLVKKLLAARVAEL